jgi:anti-anti-sigma regulatory factor
MLGKLIGVARRADEEGGHVALCGANADLAELFESLKLSQLFSIFSNEQDALRSFTG